MDILSRFPALKTLRLPYAWQLNLDFDGGSGCGNSYFGEGGRAYGRSVALQGIHATEKAGDIVLAGMPLLESLWIGSTKANITRDDTEGINATWPWTGRVVDYVYEVWPESVRDPAEVRRIEETYANGIVEYAEESDDLEYEAMMSIVGNF